MAETKCKRGFQSHVMCDCESAHPLTPREKVARAIQAHDNDHVPDGYANGLSDEVSDWSAYLADRVLTALASGSGDHAELARLAEAATPGEWELDGHQCLSAPDGTIVVDYSCCTRGEWEANAAYLRAVQPSRTLALLAEIAALRDEHVHLVEQKEGAEDALFNALSRATEAERKLAEAVGHVTRLADWIEHEVGAELPYAEGETDARTFLSKEAERG